MKRTIFSMLWQNALSYLFTVCFTLGAGLFGTVLFEVPMRLSGVYEEAPTTFEMAYLMALTGFFACILFFAMQRVQRAFNDTVGMSRTRKDFFIGSTLSAGIAAFLGIMSVLLVGVTEQLRLTRWWSDYPCETSFLQSFDLPYLLLFWLVFVVLSQFIGALFMRWGKRVFFVFWGLWMFSSIIIPRVKDDMQEERRTIFSQLGCWCREIASLFPPEAWLLIAVLLLLALLTLTWRLFRRQQVTR